MTPSRPPARPAPQGVRRLVEAYDPAFRAEMPLTPTEADDPAALERVAVGLSTSAARLLDLLLLVGVVGDPVPDRLRTIVDAQADPLWAAALLVPRTTVSSGTSLLPRHYAASCRLNPALTGRRPALLAASRSDTAPTPSFPPADARWDAIILAAWTQANAPALTQDGGLRRDVEKRMVSALGGDTNRWMLALAVARAQGLIRSSATRLEGYPESAARPVGDPTALLDGRPSRAAAAVLLRLVDESWVDVPLLLDRLRTDARQVLFSPSRVGAFGGPTADAHRFVSNAAREEAAEQAGPLAEMGYPDGRPFDDAGWTEVEVPLFQEALDALHRAGVIDAARDADGVVAFRRATPRPRHDEGLLLTPDGDIVLHVGSIGTQDFGRLARLAPWVDGDRLTRHRLTREGVSADLAAGHTDAPGFLASLSRTGVPASVADLIREWQRSASRVTILSGVDVEEDEEGRLRRTVRPPDGPHRVIDYAAPPLARFLYARGRITVPHGWDPLTVRAAVARIADPGPPEPDAHTWIPARRRHRDVGGLLDQLRGFHGGELPGEIETLVLAGGSLDPVRVESAVVLHIPGPVAHALRRDWVAGPLLRRWVSAEEAVVVEGDLAALRSRLTELGLAWADEPA